MLHNDYKVYINRLFKMKKLKHSVFVSTLFVFMLLTLFNRVDINAIETASVNCEFDYTVDVVLTNTTFEQKGCFKTFDEAKAFFNAEKAKTKNLVIRDKKETTRSKIIDMDYGYAVISTYPLSNIYRSSSLTGTDNAQATYVSQYSKLYFHGSELNSRGNLVYKVSISGFTGYIAPSEVTLVPWKLVQDKAQFILRDNTIIYSTEPDVYVVKSDSSGNREMFYYSGLSASSLIGPYGLAPSWLPNGEYYSNDGINFYHDFQMTNKVSSNKYYNYFQYLPLRTRSNITGAQFDEYLRSVGRTNSIYYGQSEEFINNQNKYGVNGLLVFALANHESAFGTSAIALAKNNIFGWGAIDSDPMGGADTFTSVEHSIREHMARNLFGYSNIEDWRFTSPAYGIKGSGFNTKYASDPNWGVKIAAHAYQVDKMFGFKDYNYYGLGVVDDLSNINVRAQGTIGSKVHYMIPGENLGLINQTIAVTRSVGEYYESTSWYPIIDGSILDHTNQGFYLNNVDTSLGYVHKDYVSLLNTGKWQALPKGVLPTSQLLEITTPPPVESNPHNYIVAADGNLNIRSIPSTSGVIIGQLADHTTFYGVAEPDGKWIKLNYNGRDGYVSADYVKPYTSSTETLTGYELVSNSLTGMNLTTTIASIEEKAKSTNSSATVTVTKSDGTAKAKTEYVVTGDKITINGSTYTIAVKGDISGDGRINSSDYVTTANHVLRKKILTGHQLVAADINGDGRVNSSDYVALANHILNKKKIH